MSSTEISAEWAAQRIQGFSLGGAIKNALLPQRYNGDRTKVIKTLINSFRYPRKGPGMMWEVCTEKTKAMGGQVEMGCKVVCCEYYAPTSRWRVSFKARHTYLQTRQADTVTS